MASLKLFLFGPPRLERDGQPIEISLGKSFALLVYLAVTRQPHSRDALATLLWPNNDQRSARGRLRRTLYELNRVLEDDGVLVIAETICVQPEANLWLDVETYEAHLRACLPSHPPVDDLNADCLACLAEAAVIYTDDFLAGFNLPDSVAFDEWMFFQREELRQSLAQTLIQLVHSHQARGAWEIALGYGRRWLALDPLHEPAHRALMRLYAWSGQQAAALRQYHECARLLDEELGAPPEDETVALFEAIRAKRLTNPQPSPQAHAPAARLKAERPAPLSVEGERAGLQSAIVTPNVHHNLPAPPNPFVGREAELNEIARHLANPHCRLLTLVGPGGIGKTRLALQAAECYVKSLVATEATSFTDGVYLVNLASLQPTEASDGLNSNLNPITTVIVSAIADALGFTFRDVVDPKTELLHYLRDRALLLLLDNFEHLIEGAGLLSEIVRQARDIKLLVTSRERLNLSEEWIMALVGLAYPVRQDWLDNGPVGDYDAVRLFVARAEQVSPGFDALTEQASIGRICELVEGAPLALELAAGWLRVLSCVDVVAEIERGLDFLTTSLRHVPHRHRSMRVVFEQTWGALSEAEQGVFKLLGVFRGGFERQAAREVAGASLPILTALVDKSLVRREADGRYQMHELLRQFAAEQLAGSSEEARRAHAQHCGYYTNFLYERNEALIGGRQREAMAEIAVERDNVRAAWQWAVEQADWQVIEQASASLYYAYYIHGRYAEGEELFTLAISRFSSADNTPDNPSNGSYSQLISRRGSFRFALGAYEDAAIDLHAALEVVLDKSERAFTLHSLGTLEERQGKYTLAELHLRESEAISRQLSDRNGLAEALHGLSDLAGTLGQYEQAREFARECLTISREVRRPDLEARALQSYAWSVSCMGAYEEAERCYQDSAALAEGVGDRFGMAVGLQFVGWMKWCRGYPHLEEARRYYERALSIHQSIGHRPNMAMCLGDLALAVSESGAYEAASSLAEQGLRIAREIGHLSLVTYNLCSLSLSLCAQRRLVASRACLTEALTLSTELKQDTHTLLALFCLATVLHEEGNAIGGSGAIEKQQQAVELLTLVSQHPATWHPIRDRANFLQTRLEASLPQAVVTIVRARGASLSLETVVAEQLSTD